MSASAFSNISSFYPKFCFLSTQISRTCNTGPATLPSWPSSKHIQVTTISSSLQATLKTHFSHKHFYLHLSQWTVYTYNGTDTTYPSPLCSLLVFSLPLLKFRLSIPWGKGPLLPMCHRSWCCHDFGTTNFRIVLKSEEGTMALSGQILKPQLKQDKGWGMLLVFSPDTLEASSAVHVLELQILNCLPVFIKQLRLLIPCTFYQFGSRALGERNG